MESGSPRTRAGSGSRPESRSDVAAPRYDLRVKRVVPVVLPFLGVAAILLVMLWCRDGAGAGHPEPPAASSGVPSRPGEAFPLTVEYVYDGDTIRARMLTPNDVVRTDDSIRIRLIGVDTPEAAGAGRPRTECWADEARAHLAALLPEGSTVWAAVDRESWDHYARRLFHLWTEDGRSVADELVAAGDAEAISVWPNVGQDDRLRRAQGAAETSAAGRWGACR